MTRMRTIGFSSRIPDTLGAVLSAFGPEGQAKLASAKRSAYIQALRSHDWSFQMSEDPQRYEQGRESLAQLRLAQRELDPDFCLWDQHCHPNCIGGRSY